MTAPGASPPEESFVIGSGFGQDITEESANAMIRADTDQLFTDAVDNFRDGILGGFADIPEVLGRIRDAVKGISAPTSGPLKDIMDAITGKAEQADLAALQSRTQSLEGVVGYAHAYCTGGFSMTTGAMAVPMTVQIGPSTGATVSGLGSIFLNSKGLWVADAQITVDYLNIGVVYTNMEIRVYAPNGTLYAQRYAEADSGEKETLSVHMPFTVPTSGYYVQVWANAALGRGIKGGSVWNGLSVDKRSTETS